MDAHPVEQPIRSIQIDAIPGFGPDGDGSAYFVGDGGVTLIEACTKPGIHCDIPYVRVWAGGRCVAEFCQHNIVGVYFEAPAEPLADESQIARWKAAGIANIVNGSCTSCGNVSADCDCLPF